MSITEEQLSQESVDSANAAGAEPDPASMPLAGIEQEICALAGQIAAATCRFLVLLADFDAREGWGGVNIRSCAHWLSWRCGLDLRTAREHLRVAHALKELPVLRAAFAGGRVSYSKVRAIARIGTPENENDLVDAALHATAAQVERLTRGIRTAQRNDERADPSSGRPEEPVYATRGHFEDDGSYVFWGRLAPEDGARFTAGLVRAETERLRTNQSGAPVDPDPSDPSDPSDPASDGSAEPLQHASPVLAAPPSNLGPALIAMAEMACSMITAPIHAPGAEVIIHVDAETLYHALTGPSQGQGPAASAADADPAGDDAGSAGAARTARPAKEAHLQDGPALYAASLRRLADDGRLRTAVLAKDGRTLNLGRSRRTVSPRQLMTLWQRDHGCTVPGCGRIRFLHAHHVVFWSRGGLTDVDNLLLLCTEHHRDLHEGKFSIQAHGRQRFTFHTPEGGTFQNSPTTAGSAAGIRTAYAGINSETIIPDWDGTPLYLHWAVGSYLENWAERARRAAATQQTKDTAAAFQKNITAAARAASAASRQAAAEAAA